MNWSWVLGAGLVVVVVMAMLRARGRISGEQAKQLVADGALLLDVRSPAEFDRGHIPGARNIPLQQLGDRLGELGEKTAPIVVHCAAGVRSASAVSRLRGAGFTAVHDLGAMSAWPPPAERR